MTQREGNICFDEANELWFRDGYTAKAVTKYAEALRQSGDDPVIAFQLSSVLWALGQRENALHHVAIAERKRQLLGPEGQQELDALKSQCETEMPKSDTDGRPGKDFDMEQLLRRHLSKDEWFRIALSAEAMGLYGVALRAYELCERGFLNVDLLRDLENVRLKIENQLDLLQDMRKEMSP